MVSRVQILAVSQGLPGTLWAALVVWYGATRKSDKELLDALAASALLIGLTLAAMILTIAFRRFVTRELAMGEQPDFDSPAGVDQRVLRNTVEQALLTLCILPAAGVFVSPDLALILGANFILARTVYWIGYRLSRLARIVGFAMGFYAALFAGVLAVMQIIAA